jgi:PrtD family type I secretion system ABC transporter
MQGISAANHRAGSGLELGSALRACRGAFLGIGLITGMINVLYLTGSFFMLEVYDRVIPSRSMPTLVGLGILAGALYLFQGCLDLIRGRLLVRIGAFIDEAISGRAFDAVVRLPLISRGGGDGLQPIRDLDQVRSFLSGMGPPALFDLPWMPLYLGICFAFHFWIGITAVIGGLILVAFTLFTDILTRAPAKEATGFSQSRNALAEAGRRNAEVLQALGMAGRLGARWRAVNASYMAAQRRASDIVGGFGAMSKVMRMLLQSAVLGVGAYLVIEQQATAGIIIASSILTSRALAPVELAIANWKGFVGARQSWRRLKELFTRLPALHRTMPLPAPQSMFTCESVSVAPPGVQKLIVQDVSFALRPGSALGIIGPSGSGKSSLARALVGVWIPVRGKVRLDGATLDQWDSESLGRHIGYLPQDVELFAGTIAENIARFDPDMTPEAVIAAARAANVHELILRQPDGYETDIGEGGNTLSAGQRQRIALARALYGDPFFILLDEPNSNLDAEGEQALTEAILAVRARNGIAAVIAHRPSALAGVDQVLVMADGKPQAFGPKDEVLSKLLRPVGVPAPLKAAATSPSTKRIVREEQGAT